VVVVTRAEDMAMESFGFVDAMAPSSTAGIASSRQIVSPQPMSPPSVVTRTTRRVTPLRTPDPHTMSAFSGMRTSHRSMAAIARSPRRSFLMLEDTSDGGLGRTALICAL